jgi:receptor expression-enhancing protein 5/6
VAVLLLVVSTFLFSTGFGIDALATFIGFAYPARCTLKALKGDTEPDVAQFKFLLQYWLVFASFVAFEMLAYALVTMIPYWVILKIAFFFFCFMPHSRGAELVVEKVLEPAYAWVQEHVETHVKVFVSDAKKVIKDTTGIQLATPPAAKKRTEKAE